MIQVMKVSKIAWIVVSATKYHEVIANEFNCFISSQVMGWVADATKRHNKSFNMYLV